MIDDCNDTIPYGLHFFWYESKTGEEYQEAWGQLCGSMHRLVFLREEFAGFKVSADMDYTLDRLSYHMENYLIRIYELRERAARLIGLFAKYEGKMTDLKGRKSRAAVVRELSIPESTANTYLELLLVLDPDIALRNMNTHNTFLSLGFCVGSDIYDPHDMILDLSQDSKSYSKFKKALTKEIKKVRTEYAERIETVRILTEKCLYEMDFVRRGIETPNLKN
jgi:hypothetical protein